jgi:hypothetical protein
MENIEQLKNNYDKYISLLHKFFPDSKSAIHRLEEDIGERLFLAPRDLFPDAGGVPGGLISFLVNVAKHSKAFEAMVDPKSLAKVALFHEIGRLGGLDQDLYIKEESDWHREKLGRNYKFNEQCSKMSVAHRTLFYAAYFGFAFSETEWVALVTSSGFQYPENHYYGSEVLPLAQALQTARTFALNELKR